MKYVLINDIHLSDRAPASCTDSYLDDLFDLLYQCARIACMHDAPIILAGDVFHHKAPTRTSHGTVMRLIDWARDALVPVYAVAGNHDLCVSDDSEALTDEGWKTFSRLTGRERFATLNPQTHAFEWQCPVRIYRGRYTGEMIHFLGRQVDHLVTPNHDVYVRPLRPSRVTGEYVWAKRKAADAPDYNYWYAKRAASAWTGDAPSTMVIGGREFPVVLLAELFGWYLSEGSVEPGRVIISQSHEVHPENYDEIIDLVKALGFKPQLAPRTVRFSSKAFAEFLLAEFGTGSHVIGMPVWLKNWPPDLLRVVLAKYRAGDGTANGPRSWVARTASDRLADDHQEVGIKVGLGVSISKRRDFPFRGTNYVGSARSVSFSEGDAGLTDPAKVQYDDFVWCPELPNGTWMVRRNGRALWTGNSNDRIMSLHETQPLGVVMASGAITPLEGFIDDAYSDTVFGVPWLMSFDKTNVSDALADYRHMIMETKLRLKHYLVVTHAPLYPPGQELKFEFFPAQLWAEAMGNTGTVHYGHVHEPHGIYQVDGVTFSNCGALSRGSLHEHNLTRIPSIAIWDSETGEITHQQLDAKPADEVFRLQEAAEIKTAGINLSKFLASVSETRLDITSAASVMEHVRATQDDPALVAVVQKLLESA